MKKAVRIALKVVLPLLAVLAAVLLWSPRKEKGSKISDTPAIVTQIRELSDLTTACFYHEVVLTKKKPRQVLGNNVPYVQDEICIIADGKVRAGIDLSEITPEDILSRGDTIEIKLPEAKILEVVVNPSDFEIFVEDGKWSHDEVADLEKRAAGKIRMEAVRCGILGKAEDSARAQIGHLLTTLGYKEIIFVPSKLAFPEGHTD